MAMPSSRFPPDPGSTHVWSQLDTERQQQAISVVAQMAFHFIKTRSEPSPREEDHVHATQL
jgi:hypothetical protein